MTQLDVLYRYGVPPTEAAALAIAKVREVYGVRHLELNETEKTVRVEYDASRLDAATCRMNFTRPLASKNWPSAVNTPPVAPR